ncbi:MAG: hypothetical protein LBL83_08720, partial [Clostridiales bacterium]|nr:hypothetical protein [Clostridiales bacterium]
MKKAPDEAPGPRPESRPDFRPEPRADLRPEPRMAPAGQEAGAEAGQGPELRLEPRADLRPEPRAVPVQEAGEAPDVSWVPDAAQESDQGQGQARSDIPARAARLAASVGQGLERGPKPEAGRAPALKLAPPLRFSHIGIADKERFDALFRAVNPQIS